VRQEIKTNRRDYDGYGNIADKDTDNGTHIENGNILNINEQLLNNSGNRITINKEKDTEKGKDYNSTKNYKPTGIYANDILQRIQNKFST